MTNWKLFFRVREDYDCDLKRSFQSAPETTTTTTAIFTFDSLAQSLRLRLVWLTTETLQQQNEKKQLKMFWQYQDCYEEYNTHRVDMFGMMIDSII